MRFLLDQILDADPAAGTKREPARHTFGEKRGASRRELAVDLSEANMGELNPAGKEALLKVLAEYKDMGLLPVTLERCHLAPGRTCVSPRKKKNARRVFEGGSDALRQWWRWSRATLPSFNR